MTWMASSLPVEGPFRFPDELDPPRRLPSDLMETGGSILQFPIGWIGSATIISHLQGVV
jgi:hypothetical protein